MKLIQLLESEFDEIKPNSQLVQLQQLQTKYEVLNNSAILYRNRIQKYIDLLKKINKLNRNGFILYQSKDDFDTLNRFNNESFKIYDTVQSKQILNSLFKTVKIFDQRQLERDEVHEQGKQLLRIVALDKLNITSKTLQDRDYPESLFSNWYMHDLNSYFTDNPVIEGQFDDTEKENRQRKQEAIEKSLEKIRIIFYKLDDMLRAELILQPQPQQAYLYFYDFITPGNKLTVVPGTILDTERNRTLLTKMGSLSYRYQLLDLQRDLLWGIQKRIS